MNSTDISVRRELLDSGVLHILLSTTEWPSEPIAL
jgi:hypothetical protein